MMVAVHIAMLGWLPMALGVFLWLPVRRAILVSAMLGLLFLPNHTYPIAGLPDYDKISAISISILLGAMLFDWGRFLKYHFSLLDLPVIIWCLCPIASSIANHESINSQTGLYDGISNAMSMCLMWGVPYLLGRLYLTDLAGVRDWAIVVFVGGLIYVPLCLYEVRMSPQLHNHLYGFFPHSFAQHIRYGGFRPIVFMEHGLQVVLWLAMAVIAGATLRRYGGLRHLFGVPTSLLLAVMLVTIILCKTAFALVLLPVGIAISFFTTRFRTGLVIIILLAVPMLYIGLRSSGQFSAEDLISWVADIDEQRAQSIETRINNENALVEKALKRPILGWGQWGRWRIYDPYDGRDVTVSDGLWVISLGKQGFVGLISWAAMFVLPVLAFMRKYPAARWRDPAVAMTSVMVAAVVMGLMFNIPNATTNPFITMAIASLVSLSTVARPTMRKVQRGYRPASLSVTTS